MVEPVSTTILLAHATPYLSVSLSNFASGHFNREAAKEARLDNEKFQQLLQGKNHDFQERLESQRRGMQLAQMNLSMLQRHEDRDFHREMMEKNHQFQRELEQFRQSINIALHQSNLNFQRWRFEQEKELQLKILHLNQELQRELNQVQHQNILEQIKTKIRNDRSPLQILTDDLLESSLSNGIMPLRIFLAPPELDYDTYKPQGSRLHIETFLAEKIRQFCRKGYDLHDRERPTELLDRAWSSKKFGGGSAVSSLHRELKPIPVLILESDFTGEQINLRVDYWDAGSDRRENISLLSLYNYKNFLNHSAKSRAIEWRETKTKLLKSTLSEKTIESRIKKNKNNEYNLAILEEEQSIGKEAQDFSNLEAEDYEFSNKDWDAFYNCIAFLHCLAIGSIADIFALKRSYEIQPLLPKLLPELLKELNTSAEANREIIKPIIELYRNFYVGIE